MTTNGSNWTTRKKKDNKQIIRNKTKQKVILPQLKLNILFLKIKFVI